MSNIISFQERKVAARGGGDGEDRPALTFHYIARAGRNHVLEVDEIPPGKLKVIVAAVMGVLGPDVVIRIDAT